MLLVVITDRQGEYPSFLKKKKKFPEIYCYLDLAQACVISIPLFSSRYPRILDR
jgi:hypothetical protein